MQQELIYYMEKIDIHEEQIRLRQHCEYFSEIINSKDDSKGKNSPSYYKKWAEKSTLLEVKPMMLISKNVLSS